MKRILVVLISVVVSLLVACDSDSGSNSTADQYRVALITSQGGLGDRSFNDSGYEGLKRAEEELGIEIRVVEPGDISEGERYLTDLAGNDFDLIITLEYGHADVLNRVAPNYPDVLFSIFNIEVDQPNVISVIYEEQEASFLAGVLAALVTIDNSISQTNDEKVISAIGGVDSPGINKFIVGFEEGAHYIDENIQVLSGYVNSFNDPARAKEMALTQISSGSDAVFQIAGGSGIGVFEAAEERGVFAIGVDSDQDYLAEGTILTSVLKRVDVGVFTLSEMLKDGDLLGGNIMRFGLKEDGVGLSPMEYTRHLLPDEYLETLDQVKEGIISGEITVTDVSRE